MAPHVVRTEREKKRRLNPVLPQDFDQLRHAVARARERVDIDSQSNVGKSNGGRQGSVPAIRGHVQADFFDACC